MITVGEFLEKIDNADRTRVIKNEKEIYIGFCGTLKAETELINQIKDKEMMKFRVHTDITHKQWKELGLIKPLEPNETPDFKFRDLQLKLYYTIYI